MYFRFENREEGKRFTFFKKEREVKGQMVGHTEKSVFGTLSDGIKTGENNGRPIYENDYWNVSLCGKAYEKALQLEDNTRIVAVEFNIRNPYYKPTKKSYPQITITDFDVLENTENNTESGDKEFKEVPKELEKDMPFAEDKKKTK